LFSFIETMNPFPQNGSQISDGLHPGRRLSLFSLMMLSMLAACTPKTLNKEAGYIRNYYRQHGAPVFQTIASGNIALRYTATGPIDAPTILFLHGTPGGWSAFARYINDEVLQKSAHLVAVDRPGWGGSPVPDDGGFEGLEAQAEALKPLVDELAAHDPNRRILLVGHSLAHRSPHALP